MRKLKVCLLLLAITIISVAQTSTIETLADTFERNTLNYSFRFVGRHLVGTPVLPDSADVAHLSHKFFWRATAETVGMNIGLWAFDRYALKGHYAYISWNSIKENFRHGFEWDNDHLATNMFGHPYHGSIYFNAGRSNGFNFWQFRHSDSPIRKEKAISPLSSAQAT